jgi:hypothetical protein
MFAQPAQIAAEFAQFRASGYRLALHRSRSGTGTATVRPKLKCAGVSTRPILIGRYMASTRGSYAP